MLTTVTVSSSPATLPTTVSPALPPPSCESSQAWSKISQPEWWAVAEGWNRAGWKMQLMSQTDRQTGGGTRQLQTVLIIPLTFPAGGEEQLSDSTQRLTADHVKNPNTFWDQYHRQRLAVWPHTSDDLCLHWPLFTFTLKQNLLFLIPTACRLLREHCHFLYVAHLAKAAR